MITSRHRRHLWLFTIAVLALFFYLIRFTFWNIPQASSDQQEFQQEQQTTRRKRIPLILGYTKWFGAGELRACAHPTDNNHIHTHRHVLGGTREWWCVRARCRM
jgi:hypothetical protein